MWIKIKFFSFLIIILFSGGIPSSHAQNLDILQMYIDCGINYNKIHDIVSIDLSQAKKCSIEILVEAILIEKNYKIKLIVEGKLFFIKQLIAKDTDGEIKITNKKEFIEFIYNNKEIRASEVIGDLINSTFTFKSLSPIIDTFPDE